VISNIQDGGGSQFENQKIAVSLHWIDKFQENLAW